MPHSDIDYYKILGLGRHATDEEIKRAFRKLARDTHPDKNPNDPTAKERFQDLQRAYDTLKDNLERSKYDEDNPYHGLDGAQRSQAHRTPASGARSGTAKRYTAGASTHTPGWSNGTANRGYESGFAQQAGATRSRWGGYETYEETAWDPKGTPAYQKYRGSREYEDGHGPYTTKQSAYARTSAERTHPTAPKYHTSGPHASSSPRPKSTTGTNARYTSNAGSAGSAGPNVGDYIREARAREEAEARKQQDAERRKQEEEQKSREQEKLRREAAEELKRAEEERLRKMKEARDRERRRAEEAVRNPYTDTNSYGGRSTPTPNGYGYYPSESYASRKDDDDLLREADEQMRERSRVPPRSQPHLGSHSRRTSRSSMKPKPEATTWPKNHRIYEHYDNPENWKNDKSHLDDVEVVEVTPSDVDPDKPGSGPNDYFTETAPQTGPEYVRKDGTGVYPAPPFLNVKIPAQEKASPAKPVFTGPGSYAMGGGSPPSRDKPEKADSPPPSSKKEEAAKPATSEPKDSSKPDVNVFAFEERAPTPAKEETKTPFGKPFDFSFASRPVSAFSSNSPESRGGKAASTGSAPHLRPQSQPVQIHTPFVPPPSAPPNLQQQQQGSNSGVTSGGEDFSQFKRKLYENLLKQAAFSFDPPEQTNTSSGATARHSETETDEPATTEQPPAEGFGYEPMDAEPTGAPKTIPTPTTPRPTPPMTNLANGVRRPSSEKKAKPSGSSLDMSGIGAVPPLSRSPADVGLGGFESLKETLPFPSQAETKPPLTARYNNGQRMRGASMSNLRTDFTFQAFWSMSQTPSEAPFHPPTPPGIPQLPKETSLDKYNRFYHSLGKYVEDWNRYEAKVHELRAELARKTLRVSSTELLDTQDIVKYMERVKTKDTLLDKAFTKARDRHLNALDSWVRLRESVLKVAHQEQH
ncbi:hypothetical protein FN846DRAFT_563894 [Sphaerosporella brunnea]|uniref:J domain-containing protein n=1 Tax=Sphaerosporella brunnea TaxID=1250544 RepID=A0A5J5FB92_9PEZI|nr:hypothetical protein FN846DRAFT_563894 [Sphaerosporella brunnea]